MSVPLKAGQFKDRTGQKYILIENRGGTGFYRLLSMDDALTLYKELGLALAGQRH